MSRDSSVLFDVDTDAVGLVTINRPNVHNAIDSAAQEELLETLLEADARSDCRCVVITGAGTRAFSAGFDIHEMTELRQDAAQALSRTRDDWNAALLELNVPMVAAINGVAYGAGALLALASDIRIGSPNSEFGFTAGAYGGVMYTSTLPLIVGQGKASEYLLLSSKVSAEEALASGLLNRLAAETDLLDMSHRIAARIASNPPQSMRATKELLRASIGEGFRDRLDREIQAKRTLIDGVPPRDVFASFTQRGAQASSGTQENL